MQKIIASGILILFYMLTSYSQNPAIKAKEFNVWHKISTYDDFGDVNGFYNVIFNECIDDSTQIAYLYDFGDNIKIEVYNCKDTSIGKKGSIIKYGDDNNWLIRVKRGNGSIENFYPKVYSREGFYYFNNSDNFYKLVTNGTKEKLKIAIYYDNNLSHSFEIKSY